MEGTPDDPHDSTPPATRGGLFSWAMFDWANSAFATVIQTFVFASYFTGHVAENETAGTAAWGYALGAAGIVVALCGPVLGAIADQAGRRKPWIGAFSALCIACTALLWFVLPDARDVRLALALVATGTIGVEFASIFYNAMLPGLAASDRVGRWSGWGWSIGYAGGLACLVAALGLVHGGPRWFPAALGEAAPVRSTFILVAAWYAVFSIPLFLITPDARGTGKSLRRAARDGLRQIAESLRHVRRYAPIVRFLIARMIYIDGLATIFAFGGVYATGTFGMSEQELILFGIALNVTAGVGAAAFAWVDDWIGGKKTILISLVGLIFPLVAVLLVESPALYWTFALILGVFVGPAQAASRSYLARVAPRDLQNEMFGLFALSGKATAFAGPLLVGAVTDWTGSQRLGMSTIVVFLTIGFVLMLTVPSATPRKSAHAVG